MLPGREPLIAHGPDTIRKPMTRPICGSREAPILCQYASVGEMAGG